ncbi:hypothetical protein GCM10010116_45230 [Microbispora rosea subsp. aerata]|nr:hypothetical protein GCM10010116_45230 [Microbispora rosea subsp. aerata]GIH57446.1 hypothetical protein Mro02_43600 [Microbispora rosea subsp. aerata]GLJ86397.1 hypothetical protein GCM10017588_51340 [Microbispora rosea subsp. aerata]
MSGNANDHEIAIIGIGCRFPGAANAAEFWQQLKRGTESITFISPEEMDAVGVPRKLREDPDYVPAQSVLTDSELFDADFFGINPREATAMDPQHRVMLECAWEALEDSGYDPKRAGVRVGVFAGSYKNDYASLLPAAAGAAEQFMSGVSNDADYLATRISFKLGLTGPSVSVQTACSTSLVAVHLACESLLSGSCDLALAGGVTIRSGEPHGYLHHAGGIYSPDGRCRAFDAAAEGTVPGEAAGLVVLKRLEDALADGDRIRAVIKASAAGNDGADRVGFSAPGVMGQSRIIQTALDRSGVSPDTIGYVEAHGSGTPLGDRIEVDALTRAFRASGWSNGRCYIGSVKTNIGHTHAAAGISGLIKTILMLENREIPPSLHFSTPNPRIDFAGSPFRVSTELMTWESDGTPRRAGVSSFGMGGTGVHLVLEEAPPATRDEDASARPAAWRVLPLSAADATALDAAAQRLADHLESHPDADLAEVARTLQVGRHALDHRRVVLARSREQAIEALRSGDPRHVHGFRATGPRRRVAFMFPGLGEQYVDMGRGLHESEPVFRRELDRCLELLRERSGLDLAPVLFFPEGTRRDTGGETAGPDLRAMLGRRKDDRAAQRVTLDETRYAQPAMFAVEYALAQLWLSRGVEPDALIGYSLGEYVAATLAGVFSLEDALHLVAERARLIEGLPGGAMLAVQLPEQEVRPLLGAELSLAAINGSDLCVVAGPTPAVDELQARLTGDGLAARQLRTTHAFHSGMMEPLTAAFIEQVEAVPRRRPAIPYLSNVTGDWITDADAVDPAYYARHMCQAVRFGAGVEKLWQQRGRVLLEVGPGQSLGMLAQQARPLDADPGALVLPSLPGVYDPRTDAEVLASTTGKLWLTGVDLDWDRVQPERRRAVLPTYPFQRRRYWPAQTAHETRDKDTRAPAPPDGRRELADWFHVPEWEALPPLTPAAEDREPARWLVFADDLGVGDRLVRRLAERGERVVVVRRGKDFTARDDGSYLIDPGNGDHYDELLRRLGEEDAPTRIAHLWLVGEELDDPAGRAAVEAALRDGFAGLVSLAQAVGRQARAEAIEVSVISSGAHAFAEAERSQPGKALALGPCRVWPLENPSVACRAIDVGTPSDAAAALRTADRLLAEMDRPIRSDTGVEVLALRGRRRWAQIFRPVRLDRPAREGLFRTGGTYLITGGLGGIGLSLATHLAETVRANLVLVGRSGLPPREEWPKWAGRPAGDPVADRVRAVRRLESAGATVVVAQADVTDDARMSQVVREAVERFGAVHGVVHAAGVPGGGLIQLKDPGEAVAVLAPKVLGALTLRRVCEPLALDFLVMCSSGIAVTGGVGQVDYCAANAFLDALAHHDEEAGRWPVVSINWDAWREVGMAARVIGGAEGGPGLDREMRHPFLDGRLAADDRHSVYVGYFDAGSWLVDEHRMLGRPVVPGVGHLELVRAAFADDRGHEHGVELTDVTFYTPIVVPEDGRVEVRVVLERDGGDGARYAVVSSRDDLDADGSARWQLHSSGRVAPLGPAGRRRLDIETLVARPGMRDLGSPEHEGPMGFGARSRCLERMWAGDGEFLARLALPPAFASDLDDLGLHPALMDISTAFVGLHVAKEFRIPISYGRIRVFAPLPAHVYSHQVYRDGDEAGKETVTSDVTITDLDGNELVAAEQFVLKRVHDLDGRLTAAERATPGEVEIYRHPEVSGDGRGRSGAPAGFLRTALDHGMSPRQGTEVLERILAHDLRPQVLVSTRDLATVLDGIAQARHTDDAGLPESSPSETPAARHPRPDLLTPYEAPRDGVEERLASLWQELLGVEKVGVHDHFFDLGGHSLLGLQLVARLRAAFAVDLPIGAIFDALTVADLAGVLRKAGTAEPADA